jgi:hypothetical protein
MALRRSVASCQVPASKDSAQRSIEHFRHTASVQKQREVQATLENYHTS